MTAADAVIVVVGVAISMAVFLGTRALIGFRADVRPVNVRLILGLIVVAVLGAFVVLAIQRQIGDVASIAVALLSAAIAYGFSRRLNEYSGTDKRRSLDSVRALLSIIVLFQLALAVALTANLLLSSRS